MTLEKQIHFSNKLVYTYPDNKFYYDLNFKELMKSGYFEILNTLNYISLGVVINVINKVNGNWYKFFQIVDLEYLISNCIDPNYLSTLTCRAATFANMQQLSYLLDILPVWPKSLLNNIACRSADSAENILSDLILKYPKEIISLKSMGKRYMGFYKHEFVDFVNYNILQLSCLFFSDNFVNRILDKIMELGHNDLTEFEIEYPECTYKLLDIVSYNKKITKATKRRLRELGARKVDHNCYIL
jgi:hypothetical protein